MTRAITHVDVARRARRAAAAASASTASTSRPSPRGPISRSSESSQAAPTTGQFQSQSHAPPVAVEQDVVVADVGVDDACRPPTTSAYAGASAGGLVEVRRGPGACRADVVPVPEEAARTRPPTVSSASAAGGGVSSLGDRLERVEAGVEVVAPPGASRVRAVDVLDAEHDPRRRRSTHSSRGAGTPSGSAASLRASSR